MGDKDTREKQKPAGQSPVTEPVPNGASATDGLDPNTSYGDGLPLRVQPNRDSKYATANNLVAGYGSKAVEALQNYITSQLDPLWPDRTDGDSSILPNFGIDGAWGCETQAAYNALLESKGIAHCPERQGPNPCGEGVAPCGFDQSIVDKLKEKEDKDREKEEDAAFEAAAKDAREEAFSDQCLLLSHISQLQTKTDIRKRTYKNIHKIATNDPATIMNRLRMSKGGKKFLDIRHFELSELSPTIRLYKRYYDEGSRSPKEVEFKFNSFVDPVTDLQEMLSSQLQRGVGVGIERFDWTLQGVQPETTKKDIKATLSIHAQNFNELFRVRQGTDHKGKISDYRLIDLVLLQPKFELGDERPISKQRVRNPNFYEIKIVVGWAATGASSVISPELRSALKNTQLTMLLIVTDHQFDFRDDGSVKLNVYFRARMESLMLDERSDVLSDSKTRFERQLRKELVDTILRGQSELKENKRPCEDEKIEKIKEDYAKEIESERQRSYQFITQTLLETGRIHAAKLSYEDAKDLSDELSDGQQTSALEILNYICDEETLDATPGPAAPVDGERVINFFFLGDLLDVAINNVLEREELNYGNTKFVFGPMQFDDTNPKSNKQILENI